MVTINFGRLITAMVTPFNHLLEIDYKKASLLIEHLINNETETIVVSGSTGEPASLSIDEKVQLYKFVVEQAQGRCKVIAGTGLNDTKSSIELTKKAEQAGVDGTLLVAPYYNKPSQEGIYQHFKSIAENTNLPIILYNIPGRTAVNIDLGTILRLASIQNVIGVKDARGDLSKVANLLEKVPSNFKIYSGDDNLALPILSIGGYGVISVASHIVGPEMKSMITAFLEGNIKIAAEIHRKLLPIFEGLFISTNPSPVKYVLTQQGIDVGSVRLPIVPLDNEQGKKITKLFDSLYMNKF